MEVSKEAMDIPDYITTEWRSKGSAFLTFSSSECSICLGKLEWEKNERENRNKNINKNKNKNEKFPIRKRAIASAKCMHSAPIKCYISTYNVWEYLKNNGCSEVLLEESDDQVLSEQSNENYLKDRNGFIIPPTITIDTWNLWLEIWEAWKVDLIDIGWIHRYPQFCDEETIRMYEEACATKENLLDVLKYWDHLPLDKEEQVMKCELKSGEEYYSLLDVLYLEFALKRHWVYFKLFLLDQGIKIYDELIEFFAFFGIVENPDSEPKTSSDFESLFDKEIVTSSHDIYSVKAIKSFSKLTRKHLDECENMFYSTFDESKVVKLASEDSIPIKSQSEDLEVDETDKLSDSNSGYNIESEKNETDNGVNKLVNNEFSDLLDSVKEIGLLNEDHLESHQQNIVCTDEEKEVRLNESDILVATSSSMVSISYKSQSKNLNDHENDEISDSHSYVELEKNKNSALLNNIPLEVSNSFELPRKENVILESRAQPEKKETRENSNAKKRKIENRKGLGLGWVMEYAKQLNLPPSEAEINSNANAISTITNTNIIVSNISDNIGSTTNELGNTKRNLNRMDVRNSFLSSETPQETPILLKENCEATEEMKMLSEKSIFAEDGEPLYNGSAAIEDPSTPAVRNCEATEEKKMLSDHSNMSKDNGSAAIEDPSTPAVRNCEATEEKKMLSDHSNMSKDNGSAAIEDPSTPAVRNCEATEEKKMLSDHSNMSKDNGSAAIENPSTPAIFDDLLSIVERNCRRTFRVMKEAAHSLLQIVKIYSFGILYYVLYVLRINPFNSDNFFNMPYDPYWWFGFTSMSEADRKKLLHTSEKNAVNSFWKVVKPTIRHISFYPPLLSDQTLHLTKVEEKQDNLDMKVSLMKITSNFDPVKKKHEKISIHHMTEDEIDEELEELETFEENDEYYEPFNYDKGETNYDEGETNYDEDEVNYEHEKENSYDGTSEQDETTRNNEAFLFGSSKIGFNDDGVEVLSSNDDENSSPKEVQMSEKIWSLLNNYYLKRFHWSDGVSNKPPHIHDSLVKYWVQRYRIFLRYDYGMELDHESWFSITPEMIARHQADRLRCNTVIDAFCGAGGNAIQLAKTCERVIAIDIDPIKLRIARINAKIYGVEDRIEFVQGDFFELAIGLKADAILLSPPWGGINYKGDDAYNIFEFGGKMDGKNMFEVAKSITPNIALYLPKHSNVLQILELAGHGGSVDIEYEHISNKRKSMTAYYGNLVRYSRNKKKAEKCSS